MLRRDIIQALMCEFRLDLESISRRHGIDVTEALAPELAALAPLAADGLVVLSPKAVDVTPRGRLLVRSIAMTFDRYLQQGREAVRYSRVI
jgi:oxygen-independent coproporphyrinogen-3 oxidase